MLTEELTSYLSGPNGTETNAEDFEDELPEDEEYDFGADLEERRLLIETFES